MFKIKYFYPLIATAFLLGCGQQPGGRSPAGKKELSGTKIIGDSIIGERINGPANIRDTINGETLFSLNDSTLVTCTEEHDGWYIVGLSMDVPNSEFGIDTLKKGRKIIVDGKVVGEVLKDMQVSTSTTNKNTWAELYGYTRKNNVYAFSIIENALTDYMSKGTERTTRFFQPFIKSFQMDLGDQFQGFVTYYNYENWIDDPSPLYRIMLVFQTDTLVGVVHSRPLKLSNTTDYPLDRGFSAAFFNSTSKEIRDDFIKKFNHFINSVD